MNAKTNRRQFLRLTALSTAGLGVPAIFTNPASAAPALPSPTATTLPAAGTAPIAAATLHGAPPTPATPFIPNRAASWWASLENLQWPQKYVLDNIRRRADGFAKANIDTAINFGFHTRFDFSNYFNALHGYYATVCEELHQRGIRWIDHYSCNHVIRPRTEADFQMVNKYERHSVLLIPDAKATEFAQYEGHLFQDLCEVDLRDGSRGYAKQYQFEAFCHNNPAFLDMHRKYLLQLMKDVPFDGVEVDDMCSYPGNTTCGCKYCRERFRKDYGHEIPNFSDAGFFGNTSQKDMLDWGNYGNPVYRDWLRMKSDSVRDHVKMIKETIGSKPLMTCCSDTGPIVLNAVALDLEKMAPHLDLFMLENVGTNIKNIDWVSMDAEALNQKDIASKRGSAPALALSYALSEKGAYLGWALARYWGVSNWSSTLNGRLEEDPSHALEQEDAISKPNNWEKQHSDLPWWQGRDLVEIRVANNRLCRENGWRDADGHEHWDRSKAWSIQLVHHNVGYRFVRADELTDAASLLKENTPLVLDGMGCVSDRQFAAIKTYLAKGGTAWMALPFGTHDEKGFARKTPLSNELNGHYKGLLMIDSAVSSTPLEKMIATGKFRPVLKQIKGDTRWAARIRIYEGKGTVIHFMNAGLEATPDTVNDLSGIPLMKDIVSLVKDNQLEYEVDTTRIKLSPLHLMSPELGGERRPVAVDNQILKVNLTGVAIYGIAAPLP